MRGQSEIKIKDNGRFVKEGTIVILVDGENSGEIFSIPEDGYMGSTFRILHIPENVFKEYILKVLELHKNLLKNTKTGAAIPHLNKKLFNKILIPLPPLNEQKRIVQKIDETLCEKNK